MSVPDYEEANAFTLLSEDGLRLHWVRILADGDRLMPSDLGDSAGTDPLLYAFSMTPLDGQLVDLADGRRIRIRTQPPVGWTGGFTTLRERIRQLKKEGVWLPGFAGQRPGANVPGSAPALPTAGEQRLLAAITAINGRLDALQAIEARLDRILDTLHR